MRHSRAELVSFFFSFLFLSFGGPHSQDGLAKLLLLEHTHAMGAMSGCVEEEVEDRRWRRKRKLLPAPSDQLDVDSSRCWTRRCAS